MGKIILFFKNLPSLSYNEAKGFFSLLMISIVLLVLIFAPEIVIRHQKEVNPSDVQKLDSLASLLENKEFLKGDAKLFLFDPNTISVDSLVLLGFPQNVAKRLINYRSKGGMFYKKNDVMKIYGITDLLMEYIYPFINLPDSAIISVEKFTKQKIDLNSATIQQLKKVYMVGDVLAARIVKYRDLLGGYVSEDQLEEVFGLEDIALLNMKNETYIRSNFKPRLVRINHDSLEMLQSHPYISDRLAEDILRFREINSTIESEIVLTDFKSIDKRNFKKLILYLDFR